MTAFATAAGQGSFEPGHIFATRYRLVHLLRTRGGVDVWRADDLTLRAPVALEVIRNPSDIQRDHVIRVVRLARTVAHPAVCQVFDVGEAEGCLYCSLELINGETVGTLARQAGRLPAEKVASIGWQLCSAVAALEAAGLKVPLDPWEVLLDSSGVIRLADLGLGATPSNAPEDDAASRVHRIGAFLYALLVGATPDFERTPAATLKPSMLVADVDPRLEQTILKALAAEPRRRPASMAAMAERLAPPAAAPVARRAGRWIAGGLVAVVVAALAIVAARIGPGTTGALTAHDEIVLADFANSTGNPVFDGALKVALAVALEQSPFLRVYPDDRARETLRLMARAPNERITANLARDIARRLRLKALVAGSIGTLGSHYVLALEAIEANTGEVMAREQVEVASVDAVLRALGTAATRLRGRLGESLASIQRFDRPLPQATTASLDALHAYWLAHDGGTLNPRVEAIPHLRRAIELDPGFAMAYAALSGVYRNTGRSAEAPEYSRRAFELRERVSERERFFIAWRYYVDALQAWDDALNLSISWTRTYPREAFAFNSLGLASASFGDHEQAVRAFDEAIRLDAGFTPPRGNIVGSLIALNRYDEAKRRLAEATTHGISVAALRRLGYVLAFIDDDAAGMARELDGMRQTPPSAADVWEGRSAAFAERVGDAHDAFQRAAQAALRSNAGEYAAQAMMEDAEVHAIAGDCAAADREVAGGLALSRDNFTLERAGRALALCGAHAGVERITTELTTRFPRATLTMKLQLPVIAAIAALERGQPARAIAVLEPVMPFDRAPAAEFWPPYLRGSAYLALGNGRAAAEQFRAIVDRRGEAALSPLYPQARRKLAAAEQR